MKFSCYPSLTEDEFKNTCGTFERRCYDKLENTNWLSVQWTGVELRIKQCRAYGRDENNIQQPNSSDSELGAILEDESDEARLDRFEHSDTFFINFSITLSPTYAVPILWLISTSTPNIENVYHRIVAREFKDSLRSIGVMGGISAAYHPVLDIPAFFIHPCNTHEALLSVNNGEDLSVEHYLPLWLGLVGPAVGLYIPSKVVTGKVPGQLDLDGAGTQDMCW